MQPESYGRLIDTSVWDALSAAELIDFAARLQPTGVTSECVQYKGSGLFAATPLSAEELGHWYTAPAAEFRAGMGFANKAMWRELAAGNKEVLQWVEHGYSEFVAQRVPFTRRANNSNTGGGQCDICD